MKKIKTRIAPSNTGMATIGNLRTAIFNYLFAKKHGGDFILRIEDTDKKRSVPGSEEYMIRSLEWIGITPDDGINKDGTAMYRQSEREYKSYIDILLKNGNAYYAFDTAEELSKARELSGKSPFSYNSLTRNSMQNSLSLSKDEVNKRINRGDKFVIRFKVPRDCEVKFDDLILGKININTNDIDDKVILKSDGTPTYHGGVVIDDYLMGITYVIRGNEWVSSTPLHILMYKAFGWEVPTFVHLPLLLDKNGKKISKRKAKDYDFPICLLEYIDVESGEKVDGFKEIGYESDALLNALTLLGWNSGTDKEIFSKEELIKEFSFDNVGKSGARVDSKKLKWFNSHYLRSRNPEWILERMNLPGEFVVKTEDDKLDLMASMATERAVYASDLKDSLTYIHDTPSLGDDFKMKNVDEFIRVMNVFVADDFMDDFDENEWTSKNIRYELEHISANMSIKVGKIMPMLRIALCGGASGPQLPDVMYVIGPEETKKRVDALLDKIKELA